MVEAERRSVRAMARTRYMRWMLCREISGTRRSAATPSPATFLSAWAAGRFLSSARTPTPHGSRAQSLKPKPIIEKLHAS